MVSQSSGWSSGWCERMVGAEGCVKRNERMVFFGEGARVTLVYGEGRFCNASDDQDCILI